MRVRLAAPAASGNLGFGPLGIEVEKKKFSNGLAHNRSKVSVINSQIGFVHINFILAFRDPSSHIYIYILETTVALKRDLASSSSLVSSFMTWQCSSQQVPLTINSLTLLGTWVDYTLLRFL